MNQIKNHQLFKAVCICLIITFICLDISYAYPPEHNAGNSTLSVPSNFPNNLNLPSSFLVNTPLQERAELLLLLKCIQDYFFNVPEDTAKARENYIAEVLRKEIEGRGLQIARGIDLDGIRFQDGIVHVPYVQAGETKMFTVCRDHIGYSGEQKKAESIEYKKAESVSPSDSASEVSPNNNDNANDEVELLLKTVLDPKLNGRERDAALYKLILIYQQLRKDEEKVEFLSRIKDKNIADRVSGNVLGRIHNFNKSVENVISESLAKAQDWASHASRNSIPRLLMLIAGPTMNCGSGVVVEALAAEHQNRGGSLALSLAYRRPILPKDIKLNDTALVDTIIFGDNNTADANMPIPVFSAGMQFNPIQYKDLELIKLIEFLEIYYHRLKILIEEYQPDIIHTNHLFLLNSLVQLIAPWIPVVSTTHGTEQKMLQEDSSMLGIVKPAVTRLDKVLSISDEISEGTKNMYGLEDENIRMIGNGFDSRIFHPTKIDRKEFLHSYGIEGDYDRIVLYVGRFVKWKKLDYLLEAAKEYSRDPAKKVLTLFVGTGSDETVKGYEDFINRNDLGANVKIINKWVSMEEVGKFNNIADVFALPSDNEPFSLVLLQALACGCKVIASDCGGPKMLVNPSLVAGKQAVLIPPIGFDASTDIDDEHLQAQRYVEGLQAGIKELLEGEAGYAERQYISSTVQSYSWSAIYDKVAAIYREAIQKRAGLYSPKPKNDTLPQFQKQVRVVEVHPTNKCNMHCYKCPYGELHNEGAMFPFEHISKISEMKPEKIFVLGGGEPTLYSWKGHDISDFLQELRTQNPDAVISLCSNGVIYLKEQGQRNINILRISTHGLKGAHFKDGGEKMPDVVRNVWNNIWRYFEEGVVREQWTTFLFDKHNVLDALVIAEELWNNWDRLCEKNTELKKKKFGFKLLYLADDASVENPFHLSNPDDETRKLWADGINKIKESERPFGKFLKNYISKNSKTDGFILPQEIADANLPVREAPKVNKCLLSKDHVLIGADGNIYPCRIQAAAAAYSYGGIAKTTVDELALQRAKIFNELLPTCSHGCRLEQTLIGQAIRQYEIDDDKNPPEDLGHQGAQEIDQNPLAKVKDLLHNASTYGNMSTGKWLAFPERAELVAQGRFDDVMPVNAQFVPSERCPSNCLTCTYGRNKDEISQSTDKSRYVMTLEDMKLYIDRLAAAGVQSITFTGGGDPLFNKVLFDGIEYAARTKNLATGLFTEAHLVTDEIAERMVNVGLKFIRISFNTGRPITYKYFFGVSEKMFYQALENIEKIAAAKEKFGRKLGLGVGVIITPLNFRELMEIARLIQAIADRHPGTLAHIWYRPAVRYLRGVQLKNPKTKDCLDYIERHPNLNQYFDAYHAFTYDGKQFPAYIFQEAMEDLEHRIKPSIESKVNGLKIFYPKTRIEAMDEIEKGFTRCRACPWLTFIGSDGSVYHCVEHGLDPLAIYGNLKTQTLEEIWQSQRRRDVIEFMAKEGLPNRCPPMCMLTEQNRIFEAIANAIESGKEEGLGDAIKKESDVFMNEIGGKIGDGIKFMSLGVLFTLGIAFIEMGFPLIWAKLLIAAELFVIAGCLIQKCIGSGAHIKNKATTDGNNQSKSGTEIINKQESTPEPEKKQINFTILSLFHNRYVFYAESLGPSVIKAYLEEQFRDKVKVDIIDLQFKRNVDAILEELALNPPDIIGLSAKVLTYGQMMAILEKRKKYPLFAKKGTLFVVGNITGATMYEQIIAEHKDIMVVVGEGEEASRDLVLFLRGEKPLGKISNTAYWDPKQNKVVLNPSYNTVNFSSLPAPDRKNAEETIKNNGVVYAEFSRGCSWGKCTFCSMWDCQKREWRHKPVEILLKELDTLQKMGAKRFEFTDSDFMGPNPQKVDDLDVYRTFAEKKIETKNKLKFFAYMRVHSVYCKDDTEELRQAKIDTLKLLKKAGLQTVSIGGDYGSDEQSKRFNKGTTKEEVREAIRILEDVGIENIKLGMILFDPFMSFDELVEGMEFVKNAELDKYIYFPFARATFYETSPLTKLARSNGILGDERTEALSFKATDFLDQRVGRLSRIFDAWHNENKPIIFGIQEIRREGEVSDDIGSKAHDILENIRKQYYYILDDMVSSYKEKDRKSLEAAIFKHLTLRAEYCKALFELLRSSRKKNACNNVYKSAIRLYYSDILMARILQDSEQGNFLDWGIYRKLLDLEPDLSDKDKKVILQKTFIRVQQQIKFRNPKLHIPSPEMKKIKSVADGSKRQKDWKAIPELDNMLSINEKTGGIKFETQKEKVIDVDFDLWIIRHGRTLGNDLKILEGDANLPVLNTLNEKGKEQALQAAESLIAELGERIKSGKEDFVVVTSEMVRSQETADILISLIKEKTGVSIKREIFSEANGMSFGVARNRPYWNVAQEELRRLREFNANLNPLSPREREISKAWYLGDARAKYDLGEDFVDVLIRQKKLLEKLNGEYKGKTVIMVGHGVQLSAVQTILGDNLVLKEDEDGNKCIKWRDIELKHSECRHVTGSLYALEKDKNPENSTGGEIKNTFDQIVGKVSSITGATHEMVDKEIAPFKNSEKGMKMLWALGRRLKKVQNPKKNELMAKMDINTAIKYLLILSWELECGNDDLIFVDKYSEENNANIDDLQRAINFCFNELDVNSRHSITSKKVLMSVQINAFDINEIPRIMADDKTEPFAEPFDKGDQLSERGIAVPEIKELMLDSKVFNPVIHYQMTGVLAKAIPNMSGKKVLDVGTGTGVLGIVSALRGADKVVGLDINKHACDVSRINTQEYGVSGKVDVRWVTDEMQGKFFEAINSSEKFDLIITNPPWGEGAMVGDMGKALSDPRQEFLRYFLKEAPNFLNKNGEIVIGYSSRNDYDEKTFVDAIESLRGVVDYDWEIIGSLEFTRPLYSEMFYAVRLKPVESAKPSEIYINNRQAKVIKAYNEISTGKPIRAEDGVENIVLAVMGLIEERGREKGIEKQIEIMKTNVGRLYIDSIVSSAIVKARAAKRMDQQLVIGLDISWIPGMEKGDLQNQAITPLIREILGLETTLRRLGLKNVKVVKAKGDELAGEVLSAMKAEEGSNLNDTTFDNVIILADKGVVEAESFAVIRDGKDNERPFIAGIDATQLHKEYKESMDEQLYVCIIEMIAITLEASVGVDVSRSSLVSKVDMQNKIIMFMPRAEVIMYEMLRERYRAYIELLQAA